LIINQLHNFLIMQNRTKFKTLWGGGVIVVRVKVCYTSYLMHYKAIPAEHFTVHHYIENFGGSL
jgi:hypothetical protein